MSATKSDIVTGGCNCGAVRFEGVLSERGIGVCHCKMCRRAASGPFMAARMTGGITVTEPRGLKWWQSSDWGRRGFCGECGSTLFWGSPDPTSTDWAISAGALDIDPDREIFEHIFADCAAPYYRFADTAPRLSEAETIAKFAPASGADGESQ
ncbi:MAG: GFA family protein [Neomegalonema sp.]|nr:GFA family protein [Neomegalonema sp.]